MRRTWALFVVGALAVIQTSAAPSNSDSHNTSLVNVPSELLIQLLDVSKAIKKLLPASLEAIVVDKASAEEVLARVGDVGYNSLLSLALRHHALLQQRNEDLLIQQGRCTARIEALQEDKQELKKQLEELRQQVTQHRDPSATPTSATPPSPPPPPPPTTPEVDLELEEKCVCRGNVSDEEYLGGCVCPPLEDAATDVPDLKILGEGIRAKDCAGHQREGGKESGIYEIYPSECKPVRVWCDLETDGGGWTVFLNRLEQPNQENFTRNWQDYRDGFGDVSNEYWLGNEVLHQLTNPDPQVLRVDAEDFNGSRRWGIWSRFRVDEEEHNYKLLSVMYSSNSTMGDGLLWHSGMEFSTIDRDNDMHKGSCSSEYKGGWWYNVCHNANPTGILVNSDNFDSVGWVYWSPRQYKWASLRFLQMKIRPKTFGLPITPSETTLEIED